MFHSILSSSINIGLLNPIDIIEELAKYKSKVKINSFEGYIRQLFWREYQRYCYIYAAVDFKKNYFGNKKKLSKAWYTGELGIPPVDDFIKSGFETAYMHHIGRLMFVGNFMNLSGISPKEGFRWFMEFSIDSYEWVMYQNVYDMVFFVTGGLTMRKPYVTSSNYVLKMSDYKKGEWSEKWTELYRKFMKKNKQKLWKFRYHFPQLKNM
jgi:deoxyribodipyrimidine photolyase-related protein